MSSFDIASRLGFVIVLLLSLSVHEWAHAISAYWLGDDTAKAQGRLTLNPLAHIDPVGTLLLPMLGVPFGWAKPVPVNPARFRRDINMRTGWMITAAAGPISNIVLAVLCAVAIGLLVRFAPNFYLDQPPVQTFLQSMVIINAVLAVFNMLPIPPLDGSRVADRLVPDRLRPQWERFMQVGPVVLMAVIFLPYVLGRLSPSLAGFSPIRPAVNYVTALLGRVIEAVAFS